MQRPSVMNRWRRYAAFYRGAGWWLLASAALSTAQSLVVVPTALLVKYALDVTIPAHDPGGLGWIVTGLFALYVLNAACTLASRHIALTTTKHAIASIRQHAVDALYTTPLDAVDGAGAALHNTIVNDTERVDVMSNAILAQLVPAIAIGAALTVWLSAINLRLFATVLPAIPLALLANRLMRGAVRRHVAHFRETFETFSGRIWHALRTIELTMARQAGDQERERTYTAIQTLRIVSGRMAWLSTAYGAVQGGLAAITGLAVLFAGGRAVANGTMTVGDLASFYVAIAWLAAQTGVALSVAPVIASGDDSLAEVMRWLERDRRLPYGGERIVAFDGRVTIDRVTFAYGDRTVLRDVSLDVPAHGSLAIVGANGAGKTTLMSLVLGLRRPDTGMVKADGIAYDELDLAALRRSIGVVLQHSPLLDATVRENLVYGTPDATDDDVSMAAACAAAGDFIERLPRGYDTMVGEGGVRLSGGERQRLALARALVGRPALLVLDEPTTHMDAATAAALVRNVRALPHRPTILITTHDHALAAACDAILQLELNPDGPRSVC